MKRENQTLILCKQPIKIFCIIERNILQTVLLSFFCFYFLSALQSDDNSNTVYVLGHKYILGPSQISF